MLPLLLLVVLVGLAWKYGFNRCITNNTSTNKPLTSIPAPSTFDKRLGNLPELAKAGSLHDYLTLIHKQYFEHIVVSLASPELFKQTNKLYNRPLPLFMLFKPLIGELSLQYANDDDMKLRRKFLDPFFSHSSVKTIFPVFVEATNKCIQKWNAELEGRSSIEVHAQKDLFQIAIYAIALSAFGSSMTESDMQVLHDSYDHCWGEMEKSIKGSPIEPGTPREAIFFQQRDIMFDLVQKMVDKRKTTEIEDEEGNINKGIGGLIEFMLNKTEFSHEQIKCDTVTFLIGGFHTTANFIIWALYFLAKNTDIQEKARKEIEETMGERQREINFEAVCGMPYLTAVLNETLRAPFSGRYSNEDEVIGGFNIPKGTILVQALGVVLQSNEFWEEAENFNPERFFNNNNSKKNESSAQWNFKPFGVGTRMCPASKYAMLEGKAVISLLLQKFKFTVSKQQMKVTAEYGLVGQMKEELLLNVIPL